MTAGSSLDGSRVAPADDVIQGGVHCRGDAATARKLEKIAGINAPTLRRRKPRTQAPKHCAGCGTPMHPWTRGTVPEGVSMHHARGWGTCCRAEYARHLKEQRARGEVGADIHRKEVDRRRHHPETITARLRTTAVAEGWTEERLAEEVDRALEKVRRDRDRRRVERARKREQMPVE